MRNLIIFSKIKAYFKGLFPDTERVVRMFRGNYPNLGDFMGFSRHLGLEAHSRAAQQGFEPQLDGSEPSVLPLDDRAKYSEIIYTKLILPKKGS
jgi:hypothetical protein